MKALFIGGPLDGQEKEKEVTGTRHYVFTYGDTETEGQSVCRDSAVTEYEIKKFSLTGAGVAGGVREWFFGIETGKTEEDVMEALYRFYSVRSRQ